MSMTVLRQDDGAETWKVGSGGAITSATTAEINYLVLNPTAKADAIAEIVSSAPSSFGNLPLAEVRFGGYTKGGDIEATAVYASSSTDGDDGYDETTPTMSFDCGGGTKHVTHCISQTIAYPPSGGKNPGNMVGWNGNGGDACQIDGVDIPTAQLRETYTRVMNRSALTNSYKRTVAALVGKVNADSFKGWSAGEVMFLGMSYSAPTKGKEKVVVTYNFSIQPNETNVTVAGHEIGNVAGYDYVWTIAKTDVNSSTNAPEAKVEGVYVAQVCERASFGGLGL